MKSLKFLWLIGLLAILGAIFAAGFFFGGFYNVAASQDDPDIVNWAIGHVRDASIGRHATVTPTVSLDDPALIQAGAKAFSQRGCVNCHGGPGAKWAKFSEGSIRGRPISRTWWTGHQERHQDDRHAELRQDRGAGPGNLEHGGVCQEAADGVGG